MDEDAFEGLVVDALDQIPDDLARLMENVVVLVRDRAEDDPDVLGHYVGVDLTERGPISYGMEMPDRIVIYRLPHLDEAEDLQDLRDLVTETVVHEVAHHYGIDDDRLDDLGWA